MFWLHIVFEVTISRDPLPTNQRGQKLWSRVLWEGRFFSCLPSTVHLWVEQQLLHWPLLQHWGLKHPCQRLRRGVPNRPWTLVRKGGQTDPWKTCSAWINKRSRQTWIVDLRGSGEEERNPTRRKEMMIEGNMRGTRAGMRRGDKERKEREMEGRGAKQRSETQRNVT